MEDILLLFLQGLFEVVGAVLMSLFEHMGEPLVKIAIQVIIELLKIVYSQEVKYSFDKSEFPYALGCLFLFIFGLSFGAASVWIDPTVALRHSTSRLMALVIVPILAGFVSWYLGKQSRLVLNAPPIYYFLWSFLFSLGFCVVRFTFCTRPGL